MTTTSDFIEDPEKLLSLIREVIRNLAEKENQQEIVSMEAQLREISKAIENLERRNIQVPDTLRSEKTRLAAAMTIQSDTTQTLKLLTEGLENIVKGLKQSMGESNEVSKRKRARGKRSTSPKTSGKILRNLIIEALKKFGGSAPKRDIHDYIKEKLDGQLLPGDNEDHRRLRTGCRLCQRQRGDSCN